MHSFISRIAVSFLLLLFFSNATNHPIYVSVTEMEHNAKENILEVTCKIFTNDFEMILRRKNSVKIDLLNPKEHKLMDELVSKYIQQHLSVQLEGKPVVLKYLGYEQSDESIQSFFQVENVKSVKHISIQDNILYEYKSEQMSLLHVIVNGNRKSIRLNNPEDKADFRF